MNPEDETELCQKKSTPCEPPTVRSSMRSSMRMTRESRCLPLIYLKPQVECLYLSADQHRTLAKIERCHRTPVASLIHLPYQQSLQSLQRTVQMQVKFGPKQSKDGIISGDMAEARQKKKQPCRKLASQRVSSSAASFAATLAPSPNVLYSSLGADKLQPRVLVDSWLDNLDSVTMDLANSVLNLDHLGRVCAEVSK